MIDLPESYEDSEREANDDEMREAMEFTIPQIKEMLEKYATTDEIWRLSQGLVDARDFINSAPSIIRWLVEEVGKYQKALKECFTAEDMDAEAFLINMLRGQLQRLTQELQSAKEENERLVEANKMMKEQEDEYELLYVAYTDLLAVDAKKDRAVSAAREYHGFFCKKDGKYWIFDTSKWNDKDTYETIHRKQAKIMDELQDALKQLEGK